jgi:hypothetical protein
LVLVSGVLAGIQGRARLGRRPGLATAQAVLVGLIAPVLLAATLEAPLASVVYTDSRYTVTVTEHVAWMDEHIRYPEVEFFSTPLLLFEQNLGHVSIREQESRYSTPQLTAWWQGVSSLTFEAASNRGVAWRDGIASPFSVTPPYSQASDTTKSASSAALPVGPAIDTTGLFLSSRR